MSGHKLTYRYGTIAHKWVAWIPNVEDEHQENKMQPLTPIKIDMSFQQLWDTSQLGFLTTDYLPLTQ